MGGWKGRMLDLFEEAGIRKKQRLPQLRVVVTLQREKAPVRARRYPAFRANERRKSPALDRCWRVPGAFRLRYNRVATRWAGRVCCGSAK